MTRGCFPKGLTMTGAHNIQQQGFFVCLLLFLGKGEGAVFDKVCLTCFVFELTSRPVPPRSAPR